ncbi:hypothetical protein ACG98H_08490 [Corynebacterium sp. L4756]|uniref:hypothetical protein n=1 Tax=unclassified Corynebacterium TaxID=2624378 RepID=UPI00374D1E29
MYRLGPFEAKKGFPILYQPIPGSAQLLRFQPQEPDVRSSLTQNLDEEQRILLGQLVGVALDVASGLRPLIHLTPTYFDPSITTHLSAWTRRNGTAIRPKRMWMQALHGRKDGEYFGTAILEERKFAFTGRFIISEEKLRAFRLL